MGRARSTLNDAGAPRKGGRGKKAPKVKPTNGIKGKGRLKKKAPVVKAAHELINEADEDMRARSPNWTYAEKMTLFMACNARRKVLREPFQRASGGVYHRQKGWSEVADEVNKLSYTVRTWDQCKDKVARFCMETKEKYRNLVLAENQTGNAAIDNRLYLDTVQEMALDYLGQECVIGVPGASGTPIIPEEEELPYEEYVTGPWNPQRLTKPDYSRYLPE